MSEKKEMVALDSLTPITVREFDWASLLKEAKPELDPLASIIPHDQHALFFSSFSAMLTLMDESDAAGTPILQSIEPRSEDAMVSRRYQKQLCLSPEALSRLLGPQIIAGVAITGSDPYLRVGSDVAVIFEAKNLQILRAAIAAKYEAAKQADPSVLALSGDKDGLEYQGVVSLDRSISSYTAALDNAVVVTNSLAQLQQLAAAWQGKVPALAQSPEYAFFRSRYPHDNARETGLLVLSDATIRRWCGPRWRIADSRRTLALAALADMQAQTIEARTQQPGGNPASAPAGMLDLGKVQSLDGDMSSSIYGSLGFMTPIIELPLTQVYRAEADAYAAWRDSYQRNWRQYFDPIAVRFEIESKQVAVDITVMPLIAGSDFNEFLELTRGVSIAPNAGDPHRGTLLHVVMALNKQSRMAQMGGMFATGVAPGLRVDPLGWLGQSVALYLDDDPFWNQFEKVASEQEAQRLFESKLGDIPIALNIEVSSPLKLAAFLTALRGFADQSAPGLVKWENLTHNERPYVKASALQPGQDLEGLKAVYYAPTSTALVVSLREDVLKRALDRMAANPASAPASQPATRAGATAVPVWLGQSLALNIDAQALSLVQLMYRENLQTQMQLRSWDNLPILNQWKQLFPDQDPVAVHERYWYTRLVCPGGGKYVWNPQWQTMESTVFGHPGQPKAGPNMPLPFANATQGRFGISFENHGLRGRAIIDRK